MFFPFFLQRTRTGPITAACQRWFVMSNLPACKKRVLNILLMDIDGSDIPATQYIHVVFWNSQASKRFIVHFLPSLHSTFAFMCLRCFFLSSFFPPCREEFSII